MKEFNEIIKKIGEELEIKVTLLSDNWTTVLEKDNEIHYIVGHKFDLNGHGIGNIMDDKGLFNDLMKDKGFPIIEELSFYKEYNKEQVLKYFKKNNSTLIVKSSIGTCGRSVFLVDNEKDLLDTMDMLFKKRNTVLLEPYYDIKNEYRVIVLNNKVRIIYGKEKPIVIGDGIHTVLELAIKFNEYFKENNENIKNPDYVPYEKEVIELDFRFNLSQGSKMFTDIDFDLKNKLSNIAIEVSKSLNITFASIDIIHTKDNKLLVLEANSGIMMDNYIILSKDGYNDAYNLYKDAIKKMFNI